jgi:hypothetical protein
MNEFYTQGFIDKCAEEGIDPAQLVEAIKEDGPGSHDSRLYDYLAALAPAIGPAMLGAERARHDDRSPAGGAVRGIAGAIGGGAAGGLAGGAGGVGAAYGIAQLLAKLKLLKPVHSLPLMMGSMGLAGLGGFAGAAEGTRFMTRGGKRSKTKQE